MSGKRKKYASGPAKSGAVWRQSADEATLAQNPRYNGFACGHGAHGDSKFNRAKANRIWKAQLRQEGASRGSFPFYPFTPLLFQSRLPENAWRLCQLCYRNS